MTITAFTDLDTRVQLVKENRGGFPHPERELLIRHEGFKTGLTFPVTRPHLLPGSKDLVAIFVTAKGG